MPLDLQFISFPVTGWKRVLLADGARQVINALTLYSFYISHKDKPGNWYDLNKYTGGNFVTTALLCSTAFTVIVFAGSALLLFVAGIFYIPLLCHIRGNLKVSYPLGDFRLSFLIHMSKFRNIVATKLIK